MCVKSVSCKFFFGVCIIFTFIYKTLYNSTQQTFVRNPKIQNTHLKWFFLFFLWICFLNNHHHQHKKCVCVCIIFTYSLQNKCTHVVVYKFKYKQIIILRTSWSAKNSTTKKKSNNNIKCRDWNLRKEREQVLFFLIYCCSFRR